MRADLVKEYTASPANKINISAPIQKLTFYGDTRLRYEYREGQSQANTSDSASESRFRYRLRIGMNVDLIDNWFLGVRLETNPGARSTNVTMSQTSGGQAFTKANNSVYVGQAYLRYTPFTWVSLEGGMIPQPFVTTPMVWDPDINPEGFVQQFKYTFGPFGGSDVHTISDGKGEKSVAAPGEPGPFSLDLFANFAELVYDTAAITGTGQNQFGPTTSTSNKSDTWLLGWQLGAKVHFDKTTSLQTAPTFYLYTSTHNIDYSAVYTGVAGAPVGNQVGINDLDILDIPTEFDWVMAGIPYRLFSDFAYNMSGSQRARAAEAAAAAAKTPIHSGASENLAYQFGLDINKIKKQGDWEVTAYWQHSEQYALDPNLIDDDIFDAHLNMQGPVARAVYALTDAVTFNVTYNYGHIINSRLGTGGTGGILNGPTSYPAEHSYNLVQVDLNVRF